MKLYRDMTPQERAAADREFEENLFWQKHDAEQIMQYHDSLDPEQRRRDREEEFADWY